jgi:hypothetical protein
VKLQHTLPLQWVVSAQSSKAERALESFESRNRGSEPYSGMDAHTLFCFALCGYCPCDGQILEVNSSVECVNITKNTNLCRNSVLWNTARQGDVNGE